MDSTEDAVVIDPQNRQSAALVMKVAQNGHLIQVVSDDTIRYTAIKTAYPRQVQSTLRLLLPLALYTPRPLRPHQQATTSAMYMTLTAMAVFRRDVCAGHNGSTRES